MKANLIPTWLKEFEKEAGYLTQEEIREDKEAREKHRSDWIRAGYETMGWDKELEPIEPLIEKT